MGRPRLRAALLAGAVLVTAAPLVSQAIAPHLTCGVKQTGQWERIPVDNFAPITGISGSQADSVAAYTVDEERPQDVAATNGYTVLLSRTHGCAWKKSFDLSAAVTGGQPFVGGASRIVSLALLKGRAMAAVQEGSGAGSRPHVIVSDSGEADTWATRDNGLPAQGAPRLLRAAADGRTAYLTISPTASGGSDDGTTTGIIPGLPGGGGGETPTGFLYRIVDGGGTWTLQTGFGELSGGGTGFSQLDLDPVDSQRLYGIVGGRLVTSRDGGASFFTAPGSGYTALTATGSLELVAFNAAGGHRSSNGGATFTPFPAPTGITSAAARAGHSAIAIESSGTLRLLEPNGETTSIPATGPARTGSLLGDRGTQSSFHAVAGHSLLRYVDPVPKGNVLPPIAIGDVSVPPPLPGVVVPRARNVTLTVGESSLEDFTLELPKNPTPLDLFFLVDVSGSMGELISDLQDNLRNIVSKLEADGIDLKVGVGLVGTGPTKGEMDYPRDYVYPPQPNANDPTGSQAGKTYTKPAVYKRLRAIGDTGSDLQTAIDRLTMETTPPGKWSNSEGQLIALKNVATGRGTRNENESAFNVPSWSTVPQNQEAGWRPGPDTRKIVLLATNEFMQAPFGGDPMGSDEGVGSTPEEPRLNFKPTIAMLRAKRIQVIGLDPGYGAALADLQTVAKGTGSLAPPGGVNCGGLHVLRAGDPLVCTSAENFSAVISRVLASLTDRQSVQVVPHQRTPVLGALNGKALLGLDVKQPNSAPFQVRVSCIDVPPGSYVQDVDLLLRRTVVGQARVNVTCVKADAATRPRPVTLSNPPPPPAQPVPNAVPPPAPPPPAAQPQVQPQVQTQVQLQPLTAGAMQEQQELQLALALNGTYKEDDPAFNAGQQMAMVDRRKRQEVQALGLLAFAVVTCGGLGLARLRARPELGVRRAR